MPMKSYRPSNNSTNYKSVLRCLILMRLYHGNQTYAHTLTQDHTPDRDVMYDKIDEMIQDDLEVVMNDSEITTKHGRHFIVHAGEINVWGGELTQLFTVVQLGINYNNKPAVYHHTKYTLSAMIEEDGAMVTMRKSRSDVGDQTMPKKSKIYLSGYTSRAKAIKHVLAKLTGIGVYYG